MFMRWIVPDSHTLSWTAAYSLSTPGSSKEAWPSTSILDAPINQKNVPKGPAHQNIGIPITNRMV